MRDASSFMLRTTSLIYVRALAALFHPSTRSRRVPSLIFEKRVMHPVARRIVLSFRLKPPIYERCRRSTPLLGRTRHFHTDRAMMSPLKRKAEKPISPPKTKKAKVVVPEYHLTPSRQDESGGEVWPARKEQIERARELIREW
jgi:hypothetical protein